ncbi:unnamed protein product [Adineta ricciae]|uniref:Uncharacterized protein n=1 Tax=Adineta ricciae TaxID=249248 RepID=A0A813TUP5_ADIRI|nr:unnamed protein product [Adineta ricciae]
MTTTPVLILLALALIIPSLNGSNPNERLPTFWDEAPSSISGYPLASNRSVKQDLTRLIDPWLYIDRLGLYKILIITTTPLMPFCSSSNVSNILFGLPSQFGWQFDSNRLFSNGSRKISTDSWWGAANYYLSVIPFLAAVDAGVIQQDSFELVQRENFCSSSSECFREIPEAMTLWRTFFTNLRQANYCQSNSFDNRIMDRCYLAPMWSAHRASIRYALPMIASKIPLLPSVTEQRFGVGWAHLVDFIGMARENTNLSNVLKYQDAFFPYRLLRNDDHPPHCPDFSRTVNQGLELLLSIKPEWNQEMLRLWQRATCNYESRQDAQRVLQIAAISKTTALKYYSEAVLKSYLHECDQN